MTLRRTAARAASSVSLSAAIRWASNARRMTATFTSDVARKRFSAPLPKRTIECRSESREAVAAETKAVRDVATGAGRSVAPSTTGDGMLLRRLRLIDDLAVDDRHVRLDAHDLILGDRQEV